MQADTEALEHRVSDMLARINHFKRVDIGNEMSDWQTQDMHRHRPFTMRSRARGAATTVVRPHSLFEVKRSMAYQRRMARRVLRGKHAMQIFRQWEPQTSNRPFLRDELEHRLVDRMVILMGEKLHW